MSSFIEPSSIVLIVGAICIFLFIMHGLWFSGKPQNRKLKQNNQHDQELSKSKQVGKVRIVTADVPEYESKDSLKSEENFDVNSLKINKQTQASVNMYESEVFEGDQNASVTINPKKGMLDPQMGIEEMSQSDFNRRKQQDMLKEQGMAMGYAEQGKIAGSDEPMRDMYEIILVSDKDHPYYGSDIEEICNEYGFIQGFIQDNMKIFFVYENALEKTNEVFRICSMVEPFYFPEDMSGFSTKAIALYMNLPPRGKGYAYFKALRMASEIFLNQLGGTMQDNHHNQLDSASLDAIAAQLQRYDNGLIK